MRVVQNCLWNRLKPVWFVVLACCHFCIFLFGFSKYEACETLYLAQCHTCCLFELGNLRSGSCWDSNQLGIFCTYVSMDTKLVYLPMLRMETEFE